MANLSGESPGQVAAEVAEAPLAPPATTLTAEQLAEFRERLDAAIPNPPVRVPPPPPLTKDEVRQLLRECVTVVKPGEALVVRMAGLTPNQHREYQQAVRAWHENGNLPFPVFIFAGDELGVVETLPPGPFEPLLPVPLNADPDAPRPEPRRWRYHVGGLCPSPPEDGTCGCDPGAGFLP